MRRTPEYRFTFRIVYEDGQQSHGDQVAANKQEAIDQMWEELRTGIGADFVKKLVVIDRARASL